MPIPAAAAAILVPLLKALGVGAATAGGAAAVNRIANGPKNNKNRGTGRTPINPGAIPGAPQGNALTGTPAGLAQFPLFTPDQQKGLNSALNQGLGMLGQNQFDFAPIANQARQQFQEQTIPSIMERFTALGAGGGRSGALQQQLSQAGSNLETNLASLQSQYGLQNQGQRNQLASALLGFGFQPQFENAYFPKQPGFAQAAGQGLAGATPLMALLLGLYGHQNGWFGNNSGTTPTPPPTTTP